MVKDPDFYARRDSDDHLFVSFAPDWFRANAIEVPASNPLNTNTYKSATYGGKSVGRIDVVGAEGNDRRVLLFPGMVGFDMEVRTRVKNYGALGLGQCGLVARGKVKADGYFHGFVGWNNVVFGAYWQKLAGYWLTSPGGMSNNQAQLDTRPVLHTGLASTGGFRSGGVAHIGVPSGHGIQVGNLIQVTGLGTLDADTATVTTVGATEVTFNQALGDTIIAQAGTVRNLSISDVSYDKAMRVRDNVVTLKVWKSTLPEPAWDNVNNVVSYTDAGRASNYQQGCPGLVVAHFTTGGFVEYEYLEAFRI